MRVISMTDTRADLERAIIGIGLQSARDMHDLAGVRPEWFGNPVHADTWRIMQQCDADGTGVDVHMVLGRRDLAAEETRRHITATLLADCLTSAPYGHHGEAYTARLRDVFDRDRVAATLTRAQQLLASAAGTREVLLGTLEELQAVTAQSSTLTSAGDAFDQSVREMDEIAPYRRTPWKMLNRVIRGWRPGGLYVVGARPGVGKSLVLQRAALDLAESGPVLLATMEMRPSEVMQRMIAMSTGIELGKLVGRREDGTTRLSPAEWDRIRSEGERIRALPLAFAERVQMPLDVRAYARDLSARAPLAGILVDYLQLMSSGKRVENRTQEVTQFTRQLKLMAMEFNCPVIVASQLNRNAANENRPPNIAELRESGSIEQDADAVILLHADPNGDPTWDTGIALDAIVAKNRQGSPGLAPLRRVGQLAAVIDDSKRDPIK